MGESGGVWPSFGTSSRTVTTDALLMSTRRFFLGATKQ